MMRYFASTLLCLGLALAVWLIPAYPTPVTDPKPDCVVSVLDPGLQQFALGWEHEISRRLHNTVAVLCHGGDAVRGEWLVIADGHPQRVEAVIAQVQAEYPGRTVVLLCCNPHHDTLHVPGVYYSHSSVWCVPDRDNVTRAADDRLTLDDAVESETDVLLSHNRSVDEPDVVGNVFEFIQSN